MLTPYEEAQLRCARDVLDRSKSGEIYEPDLVFFILRDLPVTQRLGWSDLAWALWKGGGTLREAEWLLTKIEDNEALPNAGVEDE